MAKLPKAFKRKDHGSKGFTVPTGEYIGKITASDYKQNGKKTGHYLQLTFELQNKKVKGRKLMVFLNLDNPSEVAVDLANNELGSICDAAGKALVKDSKELHGKLMILKVREVPAEGATAPSNEIDAYVKMDGEDDAGEEEDPELDDEPEAEAEADDDDEPEKEEESEIDVASVTALARAYKKANSLKALTGMLEEYDITKISEIKTLDEDDLESLHDDLEEEME